MIKDDIMESSFQINQTYELGPAKQFSVTTNICELILFLCSSLVDWDNVLDHAVILSTLRPWYQENRSDNGWVLVRPNGCNDALSYLFLYIGSHPLFLIMGKGHGLAANRGHIGKV